MAQKSEVPGSQERSFVVSEGSSIERMFGFCRQIPIAESHTRAGDPDLSYLIGWAGEKRFRINNQQLA
ncbi:MAG TPA: hypothetical protein VIK39_12880, partial [Candidatus Angelobacter sp.]